MGALKVLNQQIQSNTLINTATTSAAINLDGAFSFSAILKIVAPAPNVFLSGVAASLVVQDITYTAALRGTAGNAITIAYTGGGTAGAEVVTVVGNAISVQIQSATSTATQVLAAVNASAPALALITAAITGTGSNAQTTAVATHLASGVDSAVTVATSTISAPSHGYVTGTKGQLTTTGTLPAGVTTGTNYYLIVVDSNSYKFASSLANALAGTNIALTNQGSSGASNTFTPTSLSGGSVTLQKSNDLIVWVDEITATTITSSATISLEKVNPCALYYQLVYAVSAGQYGSNVNFVVKGYA